MEKKRTVTKAKAADGSTSRVVTRNMKDGTTKVKSKTKSEGVVTKRKVTVGKKSDKGITKVGSQEIGNRNVSYVESKSTRSVKGKETVKNLNAKKGEVRKTKSKIDGTRTMTTRNTDMSTIPTRRPTKMVGSDGKITSQGRQYMQEQNKSSGPSTVIKSRTSTKTTPAAKKTVKTKIKRMGRK
jgi:hypothetical protein